MSPSISTGMSSESVEDATEIESDATSYDYGGTFGMREIPLTKCTVVITCVESHIKSI